MLSNGLHELFFPSHCLSHNSRWDYFLRFFLAFPVVFLSSPDVWIVEDIKNDGCVVESSPTGFT